MGEKLSAGYNENVSRLNEILNLDTNFDIIRKGIKVAGRDACIYFIDGFLEEAIMEKLMVLTTKRFEEIVKNRVEQELMTRSAGFEKDLAQKQADITYLQNQINPHFLYNVLDSIYWLSQKYDADDIAAMSYSLASLFRAAVSSEDLVTLRKELELLKSFLDIQRSRFPDQISYKVDADDALMSVLLPKFSLQPLVENAVKHSIEEHGGSTEIEVKCSRCDNGVLFEVSNTGSQFPSDLQEKLRKGTVSSSSERIGLQNIDERLHLLFGDGSGLGFRNENGRAIVSFYVPWREDADSDSGR